MSKNRRKNGPGDDVTEAFEAAIHQGEEPGKYILRLFVTGTTPNSRRAIENVRRICEEHLEGRYELEIVDIYQQPELAKEAQIVAAPTLIKRLPPPLRKFIGDMSREEKILKGLDVKTKKG